MKKILSLITALLLVFSLAACGGNKDSQETDSTAEATETSTAEAVDEKDETKDESKAQEDDNKTSADKSSTKETEKTSNSSSKKTSSKDTDTNDSVSIHVESDEVISSEEAVAEIESSNASKVETEYIYTEPKDESDTRPTVYWATSEDKVSGDVAYHKKDCPIIKDKQPEELPWEIIDTLGMPACTQCNP